MRNRLTNSVSGSLRRPVFLVAITAFLTALIVQPGDVGSIDTARRLQVTHSLWTSAAPYGPTDDPAFGIPGRNGRLYAGYGIGQSLLMLPSDLVGTILISRLPGLSPRSSSLSKV